MIISGAGLFWRGLLFDNNQSVLADNETRTDKVVINEIAWMGTPNSYNDEWIELYNPNPWPVLLNNWLLKSKDGSPEIKLSGKIEGQSFFLLERTDDTSVPQIAADQIYKGGLSNQGEGLTLFNQQSELIDGVDCSLGWFAGDNETKKTMERIDPLNDGSKVANWKTSQRLGGTPRTQNSPQQKANHQAIATTSNPSNNSGFSFVLGIGLTISLFVSMLILALWLKFKPKQSNIN